MEYIRKINMRFPRNIDGSRHLWRAFVEYTLYFDTMSGYIKLMTNVYQFIKPKLFDDNGIAIIQDGDFNNSI